MKNKYGDIFYLVVALLLTLMGVYLIAFDKAVYAFDHKAMNDTVYGGWTLLLLSLTIFMVWWSTIDPFSPIKDCDSAPHKPSLNYRS